MQTLAELSDALAAGKTSSRALVDACLERAQDPAGEGARVFVSLDAASVRAQAEAMDRLRAVNAHPSPWAGIPISIKDLFDVRGEVTRAGSMVLTDAAPAAADCPVVERLRRAGFVIFGRTNMTEFAYSGVGMNPHYGTPLNPFDRAAGRIPGGSSSGAAVSVAEQMAAAAMGTDTGGSCRIPAALCGLTGFKPTASRVPRDGVYPLSKTLDSVGPLAPGVACCAVLDDILAGGQGTAPDPASAGSVRLAVLGNYVTDDLDHAVEQACQQALERLGKAGFSLRDVRFDRLETLPEMNAKGGIAAAEAFAYHREQLARHAGQYDPRVGGRIGKGAEQSAAEYLELLEQRHVLIGEFDELMGDFDAVVMPTVPIVAPRLAQLADDDDYVRLNLLLLRNPSVFNLLDACAISLPVHQPGEAPVGLMLAAPKGTDRRLLRTALAVEQCVRGG